MAISIIRIIRLILWITIVIILMVRAFTDAPVDSTSVLYAVLSIVIYVGANAGGEK